MQQVNTCADDDVNESAHSTLHIVHIVCVCIVPVPYGYSGNIKFTTSFGTANATLAMSSMQSTAGF